MIYSTSERGPLVVNLWVAESDFRMSRAPHWRRTDPIDVQGKGFSLYTWRPGDAVTVKDNVD